MPSIVNDVERAKLFRVERAVGCHCHALHTWQRRESCLHTIGELDSPARRNRTSCRSGRHRTPRGDPALKPGSTSVKRWKLRIRSPAPTSNTVPSASSVKTSSGSSALASSGCHQSPCPSGGLSQCPSRTTWSAGTRPKTSTCGDGKRGRKCEHAHVDAHILHARESERRLLPSARARRPQRSPCRAPPRPGR